MTDEQRVALVTGASRGIGRAVAEGLAADGHAVFLTAYTPETLATAEDAIGRLNGGATGSLAVDLREATSAPAIVEQVIARFGRLDLLVGNAGATKRGPFLDLTDDDFHDGFALKFHGHVRLTRAAWRHLASANGTVVNIIGAGARNPSMDFTIGGSVNAAFANFTKAIADLGRVDGVRVNAIHPGPVRTDRLTMLVESQAREQGTTPEAIVANMEGALKVTRVGEVEDIAHIVRFLASDRARLIHGALIDADGGLTRGM